MLLDLSKIRTSRDRFDRTYPASAFEGRQEDYRVAGPVSLSFDLTKDRDQYRLVGRVKAMLELRCGRCLESFTLAVDAPFDLMYLPHTENRGEGEREIEEDDLTTAYYRDDVIDLGELLREQFFLALPMKPLCSEACRGLCPQCGTNLNRGTCECTAEWEDPRLAALRSLLKHE